MTRTNKHACPECGALHHYTPERCQQCGYGWESLEAYQLRTEPATVKTYKAAVITPDPVQDTKRLFPGSHDCLPGQMDLFD